METPKLWALGEPLTVLTYLFLTVSLPSSSLLQRPFIAASDHISLLALFSQTLLPLSFFFTCSAAFVILACLPSTPHQAELLLCLLPPLLTMARANPLPALTPFVKQPADLPLDSPKLIKVNN